MSAPVNTHPPQERSVPLSQVVEDQRALKISPEEKLKTYKEMLGSVTAQVPTAAGSTT